jgi:hypothetical protein
MKASKTTIGRKDERRRIAGACLALAILTITAASLRPSFAGVSSTPPVSKCSDFACEQ